MIVVADTTPLHYLILIGEADILPILFGQVLIPGAVHQELHHRRTPDEYGNGWLIRRHGSKWCLSRQSGVRR